jgi:hypothetical protein
MNKLCYSCGEPVTTNTSDHIPPKTLFPKRIKANLITVPSCYECNQRMSLDDQYFATVLTARRNDNPTQCVVWEQKVLPQLQDEDFAGLRSMLVARTRSIWLPEGDSFVQTGILNLNMERINGVLRKIVRGLYYHHRGVPLAAANAVPVYLDPKDWLPAFAGRTKTHVVVHPDVFEYRCAFLEGESSLSAWWILFYRRTMAVGFTVPPDLASRIQLRKPLSR